MHFAEKKSFYYKIPHFDPKWDIFVKTLIPGKWIWFISEQKHVTNFQVEKKIKTDRLLVIAFDFGAF